MPRLWHLPSQVGKRFGFSFFIKNRSPLVPVSRSTCILLLVRLINGICGLFDDKFSVAGSMMATPAITPISSGGFTGLVEFLEGIAFFGQECVSTKLELVLVFFTACKLPVLSDPTLQ